MNDYGYFVYVSTPENADGEFTPPYEHDDQYYWNAQTGAIEAGIVNGNTVKTSSSAYLIGGRIKNFASFEPGEFDFNKPLYDTNSSLVLPYTNYELSNENGTFGMDRHVVLGVKSDEPYSGEGFVIRTYYKEYDIRIRFIDTHGEHEQDFHKGEFDEEFFFFPYDGLTWVQFEFLKVPAYHFYKVIGFGFGTTRLITESDLVEEPTMVSHFSLNNEELELDTLSFTVFGDESKFNFITGNKVTYSEDGKEYFVSTSKQNDDGTISVECYDALAKRDVDFVGTMRTATPVLDTTVLNALFGDLEYTANNISLTPYASLTWAGTISDDVTYREAIRLFLQGNMLALKRVGNEFRLISPYNTGNTNYRFTEQDIIVAPTVDNVEKLTRVHFSKHRYMLDKTNGAVEAFRDNVALNEDVVLRFGEPFATQSVYYVSAADQQGNETLTLVDPTKFVTEQTAAYMRKANNNYYTQEIVIKGFPYKVSYTSIDWKPIVSNQFKKNEVMISDNGIALGVSSAAFRLLLSYAYGYDKIIMLQSILNYDAGEKVIINYDDNSYTGWITKKTNNLTGVYEYEIICGEGYENAD